MSRRAACRWAWWRGRGWVRRRGCGTNQRCSSRTSRTSRAPRGDGLRRGLRRFDGCCSRGSHAARQSKEENQGHGAPQPHSHNFLVPEPGSFVKCGSRGATLHGFSCIILWCPMGEREKVLDHLQNEYSEPVRDPVWKHISLSRPLLRVAEHAQFQKLDRIRQLGPAYLVYPGATHTRRSHSLGAFHVARRMITSLVRRNRDVPITLPGVKSFLCACLLHDIGHYPFAHSLKDLDVEAHETLAAREILDGLSSVIRSQLDIDPASVAAIIDKGSDAGGLPGVDFYRRILSGVLDPDKLDYLNRDAYFCGVPYGIQDVDFILEEIFPDRQSGVAISPKGITALEDILFAKYLMYKTVYWHKTVRIATAMIKKAVAMGLRDGAISRRDLYGLDDEGFFSAFSARRYPSFQLVEQVRRRELHRQVWRVPFNDEDPAHRRIEEIGQRLTVEERIAAEAGSMAGKHFKPECVIVDVPERVSFDFDVPVIEPSSGQALAARDAKNRSVFSRMGGADLPGSIRFISVSASRDDVLMAALEKLDFGEMLA